MIYFILFFIVGFLLIVRAYYLAWRTLRTLKIQKEKNRVLKEQIDALEELNAILDIENMVLEDTLESREEDIKNLHHEKIRWPEFFE